MDTCRQNLAELFTATCQSDVYDQICKPEVECQHDSRLFPKPKVDIFQQWIEQWRH